MQLNSAVEPGVAKEVALFFDAFSTLMVSCTIFESSELQDDSRVAAQKRETKHTDLNVIIRDFTYPLSKNSLEVGVIKPLDEFRVGHSDRIHTSEPMRRIVGR